MRCSVEERGTSGRAQPPAPAFSRRRHEPASSERDRQGTQPQKHRKRPAKWMAGLEARMPRCSMMHEQRQEDDDRQGNSNQPEQCASSKAHVSLHALMSAGQRRHRKKVPRGEESTLEKHVLRRSLRRHDRSVGSLRWWGRRQFPAARPYAGKVPSARPAMKGRPARQRADQLMLSRLKYFLVATGRPSVHLSVCWRKFSTVEGTRARTRKIWVMSDFVASRWAVCPLRSTANRQ
jgi:hypothetical protein